MFIKKLQVFNYKSYFDSGVMEFAPGVNIIVGRNNAGKTSLLEVLTLNFGNDPHKIIKTLPNKSSTIKEESRIEITLQIEKEELRSFFKQMSPDIGIPKPKIIDIQQSTYTYSPEENFQILKKRKDLIDTNMKRIALKFKELLENNNPLYLNLSVCSNLGIDDVSLRKLLNFELYEEEFGEYFFTIKYECKEFTFEENTSNNIELNPFNHYKGYQGKSKDSIGYRIFDIFLSRIYRFKAERLIIGVCKFENNAELKTDASNLGEVLSTLQGKKPGIFTQFNGLVSCILPEIKWISVVTIDNSDVKIIVWTIEPKFNRDDLSLPLSSCGSGVSQVLAIVYILVCSEEPRTLIIDEPQSFLHPGAARKLIETIKQFPQHQYFIATHSPDIITTADPSNIIKLQYQDCETTASVVNSKEIKSQKEILDLLDVRLSDVFGADSILWVEGPTEKECFRLIIDKFLEELQLKGMNILSVKSTDALLDGKHSSLVANIYNTLTSGISLIPEKSIFIFDREDKKDKQIEDLERIGFKFLKRPMYENYILNPDAISAIINEEAQETLAKIGVDNADSQWLKSPITSIQIQECFDKIQQDKRHSIKGIKQEDDKWPLNVHGADVIHSVFQELCETALDFNGNKVKYCRRITEWLIKYQPEFLSELAEELKVCLNKDKS